MLPGPPCPHVAYLRQTLPADYSIVSYWAQNPFHDCSSQGVCNQRELCQEVKPICHLFPLGPGVQTSHPSQSFRSPPNLSLFPFSLIFTLWQIAFGKSCLGDPELAPLWDSAGREVQTHQPLPHSLREGPAFWHCRAHGGGRKEGEIVPLCRGSVHAGRVGCSGIPGTGCPSLPKISCEQTLPLGSRCIPVRRTCFFPLRDRLLCSGTLPCHSAFCTLVRFVSSFL